jgi:hypothetical protein
MSINFEFIGLCSVIIFVFDFLFKNPMCIRNGIIMHSGIYKPQMFSKKYSADLNVENQLDGIFIKLLYLVL